MRYIAVYILFLLLFIPVFSNGQVDSLPVITAHVTSSQQEVIGVFDSLANTHPMLKHSDNRVELVRTRVDKTFDLYLIIALVLFLGVVYYNNGRYFQNIWRAFKSPELNYQHLRDQVSNAGWVNLIMNLFFAASTGIYLYYIYNILFPQRLMLFTPSALLLILIASVLGVYVVKYFVISFSGWVFNFKTVADNYLFNVFLINKVVAILLLPVIVLLAFAGPAIYGPTIVVSFIVIGALLVNRYMRSWSVFGPVFQYSRFHFFTYLCASELLPMAVLVKILAHQIYY